MNKPFNLSYPVPDHVHHVQHQHKKIDTTPSQENYKAPVRYQENYLLQEKPVVGTKKEPFINRETVDSNSTTEPSFLIKVCSFLYYCAYLFVSVKLILIGISVVVFIISFIAIFFLIAIYIFAAYRTNNFK